MDPLDQIRERVAESFPATMVPFLAGLENWRANQRDHRQRVRDSHLMGAKALGMESLVGKNGEDDMGDIIVTGDITQTAPAAEKQSSSMGSAATAAIGAGALAAGMLLNNLMQPKQAEPVQSTQPPAIIQPADRSSLQTGLTVERGGALR